MATPIPENRYASDAASLAACVGGVVTGDPSVAARGLLTDSRAVTPGAIFAAITGESLDGVRFAPAALEAGAAIVLAGRRSPALGAARAAATAAEGRALVEVDDVVHALGEIARAALAAFREGDARRRVVGITGSAGKTTTKELTRALLSAYGPTRATFGNLNNLIGLPMTILTLAEGDRFAVLEMGMSVPGEIARLAEIGAPDVGIVTNIGDAHAEGVGGREGVAREKGALFAALGEGRVAIVNADDPLAVRESARSAGRAVTFGRAEAADYRLLSREPIPGRLATRVRLSRPAGALELVMPLVGEAAAIDLAAALAAAEAASGEVLPSDALDAALATVALEGRAQVRSGVSGITVIDDSYNANPASVRAALSTLGEVGQGRRLVAVLGEMKELGAESEALHRGLAPDLAAAGVSLLVTLGGLSDALGEAARALGLETRAFPGAAEAARALQDELRPGDVVLVKASRSVGAEAVVRCLTTPERSIVLPSDEKGASSGAAGPGGGAGQPGRS